MCPAASDLGNLFKPSHHCTEVRQALNSPTDIWSFALSGAAEVGMRGCGGGRNAAIAGTRASTKLPISGDDATVLRLALGVAVTLGLDPDILMY